jgi:hypothetical protein
MRAQMRAVTDKSRPIHNGSKVSLAELGFDYISMDDGWQQCNCSTRQDVDPTLPMCDKNAMSWHDPITGTPMVNKHRFPEGMKAMVDYGHSLGLKVGTYLNNCICMENKIEPHYEEDVNWLVGAGFDGVKIDNCGSSHNISRYAELFNKSGHVVRIENCHNFYGPDLKTGACPMNFYRSGGDIHAGFIDVLGKVYGTVDFNDRSPPASYPGCWAYPDMSEVGNFCKSGKPCTEEEVNAERSHWGLWSIVSSPLILGFDMNESDTVDRVWDIITNTEALAVNQAWAGMPGTLAKVLYTVLILYSYCTHTVLILYSYCTHTVLILYSYCTLAKVYPTQGLVPLIENWANPGGLIGLHAAPHACNGHVSTTGWKLSGGKLIAPNPLSLPDEQCVSAHHGDGAYGTDCPPPTTTSGPVGCGLLVLNCTSVQADGQWAQLPTGELQYTPTPQALRNTPHALLNPSALPKPTCLSASPMDFNPLKGYFERKVLIR